MIALRLVEPSLPLSHEAPLKSFSISDHVLVIQCITIIGFSMLNNAKPWFLDAKPTNRTYLVFTSLGGPQNHPQAQ